MSWQTAVAPTKSIKSSTLPSAMSQKHEAPSLIQPPALEPSQGYQYGQQHVQTLPATALSTTPSDRLEAFRRISSKSRSPGICPFPLPQMPINSKSGRHSPHSSFPAGYSPANPYNSGPSQDISFERGSVLLCSSSRWNYENKTHQRNRPISEIEYPVDVRDCDVALFEKGGSRMWQCHWKTGSSSIRIEHPSTAFINGNGLPTAKGGLMSDDLS